MTRYQLLTKAVGAVPADAPTPQNPAMIRQGGLEMDPGRAWAGDLYTEGNVTSPENAFAHFTLPDGTEGWLDRSEDGSLVGWVKDGSDIYRYNDADAWALDVDGAQMTRADNAGPDMGEEVPDAEGEATAEGDETTPDGTTVDPIVPADANPNNLTDDTPPGEAFDKEDDPAGDVVDPEADIITDPEHLPEPTGDEEYDNPFADPSEDDGDVAGDQPEAPDEEPKDEPSENEKPETDDEDEDAATEDEDSSTKGDPDEADDPFHKGKKKPKTLFKGKVQVKHLNGQHNQADHGNWADPGHVKPDDATGAKKESDPKSLTAAQLHRLSTGQLNEIVKASSDYTEKTKLAASAEIANRRGKKRTGRQ